MVRLVKIVICACLLLPCSLWAEELTIDDLKFDKMDMLIDPSEQKTLDIRRGKLEIHQKLGYLTAALLTAAVVTAEEGEVTETHKYLGISAALSYYATAYFAISNPEVKNGQSRGASLWHQRLAKIHLPAMILMPILGGLAAKQLDNGEDIHGAAKLHRPVAALGLLSFVGSMAIITFDF